jgi:RNA polymerase sigma-70 factor, ECF subfamily
VDQLTYLLLEAKKGDRRALSAWVRASQADVWRLCAALVDRAEADDLTQETFLRACRALPAFRADSSGRTWVLAIARRVCADTVRSRSRRRRLLDRIGETVSPRVVVEEFETQELIRLLDSDRKTAFVLTQLLGLSYAETAEICGCAIGTVRSRVARARADLIAMLEEGEAATS